jgi:hypothetical protein
MHIVTRAQVDVLQSFGCIEQAARIHVQAGSA